MSRASGPGGSRRCLVVALGSAAVLASLCAAACKPSGGSEDPGIEAEFGIFYGGQVQERRELPLELDRARQTQGFRLSLAAPPEHAVEVRWELGMPGVGRAQKDSRGRLAKPRRVQVGVARWRPGERVFEQVLPFTPGDPLGLWNIRVLADGRPVLDRPFLVYDAAARERAEEESLDGG